MFTERRNYQQPLLPCWVTFKWLLHKLLPARPVVGNTLQPKGYTPFWTTSWGGHMPIVGWPKIGKVTAVTLFYSSLHSSQKSQPSVHTHKHFRRVWSRSNDGLTLCMAQGESWCLDRGAWKGTFGPWASGSPPLSYSHEQWLMTLFQCY